MAAELARKLVAVMFTDMVGYTELLLSDERNAVEKRVGVLGTPSSRRTRLTAARSCSASATAA